jgi:AraC-like DNA-binding protein
MEKDLYGLFPNEQFMDLTLYQFGYEQCVPLHMFGPATRNHFLFHYIFSGKGRYKAFDSKEVEHEYQLEGGNGFMIWPMQHSFYMADEKSPWTYAWVEFDGFKARELVSQAGLTYNSPIYSSKDDKERALMKDELLAIIESRKDTPLVLMGHMYLFMNALISSSSLRKEVSGGSLRDFYVRESLAFIERHYHEEISVEEIAAFCNIERSYLGKVFKSVLHTSPQDFLIQYRINKSCELMKITDHTITEISRMVGYQNQFNFSRAFKRIVGQSPREWRNGNKLR